MRKQVQPRSFTYSDYIPRATKNVLPLAESKIDYLKFVLPEIKRIAKPAKKSQYIDVETVHRLVGKTILWNHRHSEVGTPYEHFTAMEMGDIVNKTTIAAQEVSGFLNQPYYLKKKVKNNRDLSLLSAAGFLAFLELSTYSLSPDAMIARIQEIQVKLGLPPEMLNQAMGQFHKFKEFVASPVNATIIFFGSLVGAGLFLAGAIYLHGQNQIIKYAEFASQLKGKIDTVMNDAMKPKNE